MKVPANNSKTTKTQVKSVAKPAAASKSSNNLAAKLSSDNKVASAASTNSKSKKNGTVVNEEEEVSQEDAGGNRNSKVKEEVQTNENATADITSFVQQSNKRKRNPPFTVGVPRCPSLVKVIGDAVEGEKVVEMEVERSSNSLLLPPLEANKTLSFNGGSEPSFLDNIDNSKPTSELFTFVPPTSIPFRGRSNTFTCSSNITENEDLDMLRLNTKVVIKGTNIVLHKAPHLVGSIGIIVEVPVHPITWFKVKFDDSTIVPFRPSALHVFGSATSAPITHSHPLSKHASSSSGSGSGSGGSNKLGKKTSCGNTSTASLSSQTSRQSSSGHNGSAGNKKKTTSGASQDGGGGNNNLKNNVLLSTLDPDTWVGRVVVILEGKLKGNEGTVLRTGNGWVQVESNNEEVPKRAYELEVVGSSDGRRGSGSDLVDVPSPVKLQRSSSLLPAQKSTHGDVENLRGRQRGRPRSYSESSIPSTKALFFTLRNKTDTSLGAAAVSASSEVRKDPKISMALRQMKYEATQKYVERQAEVIKGRPDIGYWTTQVNGTLLNREHEKKVSRPFLSEYCDVCNVEYWPDSRFCWNEICSSSPIYWRLEGARGVPPPVSVSDSYIQHYKGEGLLCDDRIQYQVRANKPYESTFIGQNNYDYSAISNAYIASANYNIDDVTAPQCEKKYITVNTLVSGDLHVTPSAAPKLNIISEYLLSLPAMIVGRDYRDFAVDSVAISKPESVLGADL